MTPPVRTVSGEVAGRVAALEAQRAADTKAEDTCRAERLLAEKEIQQRMTAMERVVGEQAIASNNLAGTVARFIEGHDRAAAETSADKDREVKVVDSKRGHATTIICAVISVIGALLVGYMSYAAKLADAAMPKAIAAAVAEGIKAAAK